MLRTCMKTFTLLAAAFTALSFTSFSLAQEKKGHDHGHAHGPHKGELIELGDEEYHAELVENEETETITIYLLCSKAKEAVAIEAKELLVNVKHDGKPIQFKLKAEPQKTDAEGTSSRFVLKSEKLAKLIEDDKAEKRLRVTIKGKTFNGKIEHHHHDHDHKDAKKKD